MDNEIDLDKLSLTDREKFAVVEESARQQHAKKYPEATKWDVALDQQGGHAIQNFLEWLLENHVETTYSNGSREHKRVLDLHPQELIYEYFEIDAKKLEQERRQMLDELRTQNQGDADGT